MDYKYKRENKSTTNVLFHVEVAYKEYDTIKQEKYKKLSETVELKGFRKGQAPRNMVEPIILKDMLDQTIQELLPKATSDIVNKEALELASKAKYSLKNVDKEKGVSFDVEFFVYHPFSIPNISKIKVKIDEPQVTEKEIENSIKNVLSEWNKQNKNDKFKKVTKKFIEKLQLPNIKTKNDLEKAVEDELKHYKRRDSEQKAFEKALNDIVTKTKIAIPENIKENIIKGEKSVLEKELKKTGKEFKTYLEENKTTEKKLELEWIDKYNNSIKNQIFLSKYGRENKITVPKEIIKALSEKYKNSEQLYHVIERTFIDKSAQHLWAEIKKANNIENVSQNRDYKPSNTKETTIEREKTQNKKTGVKKSVKTSNK